MDLLQPAISACCENANLRLQLLAGLGCQQPKNQGVKKTDEQVVTDLPRMDLICEGVVFVPVLRSLQDQRGTAQHGDTCAAKAAQLLALCEFDYDYEFQELLTENKHTAFAYV